MKYPSSANWFATSHLTCPQLPRLDSFGYSRPVFDESHSLGSMVRQRFCENLHEFLLYLFVKWSSGAV